MARCRWRGARRGEIEFLRREVGDLERVIKSVHSTRNGDRYALEQAEAQLLRARHVSAAHEGQQQLVESTLHDMHAQHAAALAAAATREAETRMLTVELRLLCVELFDAETEREAARESEGSALSIARSYRGFAAQGAARLEDMRSGIDGVQLRLLQQLDSYRAQAQHSLKLRALRATRGWRSARDLGRCVTRWMIFVFTAEQRSAVAARLEAAYRHRDLEHAARRTQSMAERREELAAAAVARAAIENETQTAGRAHVAAALGSDFGVVTQLWRMVHRESGHVA